MNEAVEAKKPRLLNRTAVRKLLLSEHVNWGNTRARRNVAAAVIDEIEAAVERLIIAHASQRFAGRSPK